MILYACVQPHPNTNNIALGEGGGAIIVDKVFTIGPKSPNVWTFSPFLAAIVAPG